MKPRHMDMTEGAMSRASLAVQWKAGMVADHAKNHNLP